jgi:hypothetical protein
MGGDSVFSVLPAAIGIKAVGDLAFAVSNMSGRGLMKQDLSKLDVTKLHPLSPEVISRQATINIGIDATLLAMLTVIWLSITELIAAFFILCVFLCTNYIS